MTFFGGRVGQGIVTLFGKPADWSGGLVSQRTEDDINKWKVGLEELVLLKWPIW